MIAYFDATISPTFIVDSILLKIFTIFLVIMASCIVTSSSEWRSAFGVIFKFDPNAASPRWKTRTSKSARLSWSEPPRAWYYRISPNSCTLVILLQVDPASGDELETVCEGYYETEDTSIFAWSSVPGVGHYRWLHDPICRLLFNSKADYLVRTIRHILDFLQLWIMA